MKLFSLLIVLLVSDCHSSSTVQGPERKEAAVIFENGLAYDGCTEHIQLLSDSLLYGPTSASLPILQKALNDIPRDSNGTSRTVTLRFIKTGQQTTLVCGWGGKSQVGELNVLEIMKR